MKYCVYSGLATFFERVICRIHPYYQDISYSQQSSHKNDPSFWDLKTRLTDIIVKSSENGQGVLTLQFFKKRKKKSNQKKAHS